MVEIEKDAITIKPLMAKYLEHLTDVLTENVDDVDELRRVYTVVQADRTIMQALETKINEQLQYLTNLNAKKGEIADAISTAIRTRKE